MIEKLEPRRFGPDFGYGGATFSDVIDKVNEIIDAMNGEHDPADIYSEDGRLIAKYNESEDERMIRKIESFLSAYGADYFSNDEWREIENWLEKQKEPKPLTPEEKIKHPLYIEGFEAGKEVGAQCEKVFKEQKPELVQHPPITFTFNSNASRDERLKAALLALLNSDLLKVKEGGYFTKQDLIEWVERIPTDKPAEWSEFDKGALKDAICATDILGNDESFNKGNPNLGKAFRVAKDWLKYLQERFNLTPKQEWGEEDIDKMVNERARKSGTTKTEMQFYRQGIEDTLKSLRSRPKTSDNWKPSEEKKKETLDGADIGYGLETAIDILENGFTHYQTDDGEYERKQALDVLIFLLNETRKKEDAKLWSKDIVESIVTWATEKLQLYSMKESTPYVEAVKNNAQKVLDWAKEQWPIYYGWKPSKEQMEALNAMNCCGELSYQGQQQLLIDLYQQLKKLM